MGLKSVLFILFFLTFVLSLLSLLLVLARSFGGFNLVTILAPGPADVHPDDMTVAIDEDLEVVEECSVDKVREVKKEFILTDFIICFQKSDLTTKLWP